MDLRRAILCLLPTTTMLFAHPASAVDLQFPPPMPYPGQVIGVDWSLTAGGRTRVHASVGWGFATSVISVSDVGAQSQVQVSGEIPGIFGVASSFDVTIPLVRPDDEWAVFWLDGLSRGGSPYDSSVRAYSGYGYPPATPTSWIIDVLPTDDDVLGTPTRIDIHAAFDGLLAAAGNGSAAASWFVSTNHGVILDGSLTRVMTASWFLSGLRSRLTFATSYG